jgi:hypothetical protein
MEEGMNITAKSSIRHEIPMQSGHFSCHIGGLDAGQVSVSRFPAKHNRLPCLVKVGHMNHNLKDDLIVGGITTETLQGTVRLISQL